MDRCAGGKLQTARNAQQQNDEQLERMRLATNDSLRSHGEIAALKVAATVAPSALSPAGAVHPSSALVTQSRLYPAKNLQTPRPSTYADAFGRCDVYLQRNDIHG